MNRDFKKCLERKKIVPFAKGPDLIQKELTTSEDDLESARLGLKSKKFKWPTIQAYYSMFHSARALLYSRGYREKSHYCLYIGVTALFVERGLLEMRFTETFYAGMILRENADYKDMFSELDARSIIKNADEFLQKACEILEYLS